ncbi:MAG: aminotransferase class I/II-fold pyridoxal phosphate-dependent enzyme [Candidatus Thorarchaeota archaeon]|jgi:aspartate/methionine/tyrosine aminotransferase
MNLEIFELERMQSEYEHVVKYNLSESGVEPLRIRDLLQSDELTAKFLNLQLVYAQTNGTIPLREAIAGAYDGIGANHILATNGGAEANFVVSWWLSHEYHDSRELVFMIPNYMQIGGIWKNLGGTVRPFPLQMKGGEWVPDIEELKSVVSKKTAAIAICTPNNPTGAILSGENLNTIGDIAADNDAWVVSDEIYRGAEIHDERAPSMQGRSEKVLVTSSLSKAYGLPGLRLGWVACPTEEVAHDLWSYTDYTSICPSTPSDWLGTLALDPKFRSGIEERARKIIRENWAIVKEWLDSHGDTFEYVPPKAAAICFIKQNTGVESLELVKRIMNEKSVLISPGEHFNMPGFLRIGFGSEPEYLRRSLSLISELLNDL